MDKYCSGSLVSAPTVPWLASGKSGPQKRLRSRNALCELALEKENGRQSPLPAGSAPTLPSSLFKSGSARPGRKPTTRNGRTDPHAHGRRPGRGAPEVGQARCTGEKVDGEAPTPLGTLGVQPRPATCALQALSTDTTHHGQRASRCRKSSNTRCACARSRRLE